MALQRNYNNMDKIFIVGKEINIGMYEYVRGCDGWKFPLFFNNNLHFSKLTKKVAETCSGKERVSDREGC